MVTEAFIIECKEKAYLNIDRTYKYGGIMLLSDVLDKVGIYIDGYTCFEEFSLEKWLNALNITDTTLTMKIHKDCDGDINSSVNKNRIDDILTITVKNKIVSEIKNSNNEIIYTQGDDYVDDWEIGWFGKVFDYYTNIISNSIMDYDEEYDDYIWGILY